MARALPLPGSADALARRPMTKRRERHKSEVIKVKRKWLSGKTTKSKEIKVKEKWLSGKTAKSKEIKVGKR